MEMIRIMRKELKHVLKCNSDALQSSSKNFEAIYNVMFENRGVMAEYTDGFRVKKITFAETKQRIERAAFALSKRIGVQGEYVALEMENCVEWIIAFWAILRSGNKPYLVNCRHPKALSQKMLSTLGIEYIVGKNKTQLDGKFVDICDLNEDGDLKCSFADEIALSTSATSLKDVICFYSGKEFCAQILNVNGFIEKYPEIAGDYDGEIKQLAFLPFYHVFGLIAVYFWFSFYGVAVVFMKDYSSDTILKTCRKHKVTHVFAVPLLWHTIETEVQKKVALKGEKKQKKFENGIKFCTKLQNIFPHIGIKLSQRIMHEVTDELFGQSIRFCINGGSYVRNSALELINGLGYNLHNGYGMSEIGITSVELRCGPKNTNRNAIGLPFSSVEYKIDDDGILHVKGNSVCHRLMIEGKEVPMGEWFNTGDKVEYRDGSYYIIGRLGDVIIGENGENINPDVIEKQFVLAEAENYCVLGLKDCDKETVSMVVQISRYMSDVKRNALAQKIYEINNSLPITSRVSRFYFTTDPIAPANAVKVGRKYLSGGIENGSICIFPFENYKNAWVDNTEYSAELLNSVKEIVAFELGISAEDIDIHSHIMLDLGATSMQYFSILSALAENFSVKAGESDTFRYTVHEMCQYIERQI